MPWAFSQGGRWPGGIRLGQAHKSTAQAGLQEWTLNNGSWIEVAVVQKDLIDKATYTQGLSWNVKTDGLRSLTGATNPDGSFTLYATTSTVSDELTHDLGADPNQLVSITVGADSTATNTNFHVLQTAAARAEGRCVVAPLRSSSEGGAVLQPRGRRGGMLRGISTAMDAAMSTQSPIKSTQIVAGVAVVLALLGGAYAVGRSHNAENESPATATSAQLVTAAQPQRLASAEPARHASPASGVESQAQPALCESCARVTDVHAETRRGQASGVGAVGGAVVGGLLGNMVGGGTGRKLATVAGAVGGGYAGNEIEKNQKSHAVWVVQVRERDGRLRRFERSADPGLQVGDEVRLTENGFSRI